MTTTAQYPTKVGGETVQWDEAGAFVIKFGKRCEVKLPAAARPQAVTAAKAVPAPAVKETVDLPSLPVKSYQESSKLEDVVLALREKILLQQGQIDLGKESVRLLTIEVKRLTSAVAKLSSPKAEQKWPDGEPMSLDVVDRNGNYVEAPEDDGAPPIEL